MLRRQLNLEGERNTLVERLALVSRYANDIILLLDATGRIIEANDRALTTYGYTLDELRSLPSGGLRPPETMGSLPDHLDGLATSEGVVYETVHRRSNGTTFPVEVSGRVVERDGQKFSLGICRDITERKQAEAALRESEDKFKFFFEHSNVGKSVTQVSGGIQVNQAFCNLLGYSPEELQNRKWQEVSHPDDLESTQQSIDMLLSGKQASTRFIKRYLHKNGSVVWTDVSSTLRRSDTGQPLYFLTAIIDITERKLAEESLRQRLDELERLNRVTVGRELRMIELKKEINELCRQTGQPVRYPLDFGKESETGKTP